MYSGTPTQTSNRNTTSSVSRPGEAIERGKDAGPQQTSAELPRTNNTTLTTSTRSRSIRSYAIECLAPNFLRRHIEKRQCLKVANAHASALLLAVHQPDADSATAAVSALKTALNHLVGTRQNAPSHSSLMLARLSKQIPTNEAALGSLRTGLARLGNPPALAELSFLVEAEFFKVQADAFQERALGVKGNAFFKPQSRPDMTQLQTAHLRELVGMGAKAQAFVDAAKSVDQSLVDTVPTLSKLSCIDSRAKAASQELSKRAHGVTTLLVALTPSQLGELSLHDLKNYHGQAKEWLNNPPSVLKNQASIAQLRDTTQLLIVAREKAIAEVTTTPQKQEIAGAMSTRDFNLWRDIAQ